MLKKLKEQGIPIFGELQEFDDGLFSDILEPEGNKIELWEPNDKELRKRL